jgi:hypothetical protein
MFNYTDVDLSQLQSFKKEFAWLPQWIEDFLYDDIPACTSLQRGYIYGMCKKLGYEEHDLPAHISPIPEPRDMNIEEAGSAIDRLCMEVDEMETEWYLRYGEKKRYGKKATEQYRLEGRL